MDPISLRMPRKRSSLLVWTALTAVLVTAHAAQASEGGASVYLLGTGGPGAAVLPPVEGVFLANTVYYYSASADSGKQFPLGGNLVAGLDATIVADFATVLWTPTTNLAGGTLALGLALPIGEPSVDVAAVLTGPGGGQVSISKSDSSLVVGDPILTAALGWKTGNVHITASTLLNVPIGNYRDGQLANLAFHRWAFDTSLAVTWLDPKSGWDVSGKAGLTFNGENDATNYKTGTELHVEGAVEKIFSPSFSAGLQAYYFQQVSGDSGAGATLGDFKGRVGGFGATAAYNFKIAQKIPATLRLHAMTEFDAKNRMEGNSVWVDFTMPLWVKR
jgi:hypothetical protein